MKKLVYDVRNGSVKEVEFTEEEISAMQAMPEKSDWLHDYPLRIVAPKTLALDYPQFYVWFMLNDLPLEKVGDSVQIYVNEIIPEHQVLIDSLNGVVTVEKRNG